MKDTRDVSNLCKAKMASLTNIIFFKVHTFCSFVCDPSRPNNTGMVVIVDGCALICIIEIQLLQELGMANLRKLLDVIR